MKKIIRTMYEGYNEALVNEGIDYIIYEGTELLYVDCNGNDIYPDELSEEILNDIQARINNDNGEILED